MTLRQLKNGNKWYEREPETVVENQYATVFLWNTPIHIDREILANKPDITIRNAGL